jgi:hypothetical protein
MNFGGCREWKREKSEREVGNWEMGGGRLQQQNGNAECGRLPKWLWRIGEQENRGL